MVHYLTDAKLTYKQPIAHPAPSYEHVQFSRANFVPEPKT